jgi:hypothetical protein
VHAFQAAPHADGPGQPDRDGQDHARSAMVTSSSTVSSLGCGLIEIIAELPVTKVGQLNLLRTEVTA